MEMILVGLWFGDHANALRFYGKTSIQVVVALLTSPSSVDRLLALVLWVGVLNLFYPVWDYIDERVFDKPNTSDCTQFAEISGYPSSGKARPQE